MNEASNASLKTINRFEIVLETWFDKTFENMNIYQGVYLPAAEPPTPFLSAVSPVCFSFVQATVAITNAVVVTVT